MLSDIWFSVCLSRTSATPNNRLRIRWVLGSRKDIRPVIKWLLLRCWWSHWCWMQMICACFTVPVITPSSLAAVQRRMVWRSSTSFAEVILETGALKWQYGGGGSSSSRPSISSSIIMSLTRDTEWLVACCTSIHLGFVCLPFSLSIGFLFVLSCIMTTNNTVLQCFVNTMAHKTCCCANVGLPT